MNDFVKLLLKIAVGLFALGFLNKVKKSAKGNYDNVLTKIKK